MNLVEVTNITKSYGHKSVLKDVSFKAAGGQCIGFVGANGCGKSTLLKILAGAIKASSGKILFEGHNPMSHNKIFASYIGYVPQENPLFDNLSVLDNLRLFYCDSSHNLKYDIKNGLIAEFGISGYLKETVSNLSGGMKKRLSIACAIAQDPKILILDEPGASLDIVCKSDINQYIRQYAANGGLVLLASHEEGELALCNQLYFMNEGVLESMSPSKDLSNLMERMVALHG